MSDSLTFMMGKYPAELPADRRYCKNHMWCLPVGDGRFRFGFSAYAVRLMQDVYFLEWRINEGDQVEHKQEIGNIETSKAVSDLYAPIAGVITSINEDLLNDPSAINVDGYGEGWLFDIEGSADEHTMDAQAYYDHLEAGWEQTQRLLKGQMNQ